MTVMPHMPGDEQGEGGRRGEREADGEGADTARRHGDHGQRGAAPPIGGPAPDPAPERADGDDQERGGAGIEPEVGAAAARLQARREERADPRPHGVQLPHVAEIAEAGQASAAIAEDRARHAHVEARRGEPVRALPDEGPDDRAAGDRQQRGREQDVPPRQVGEATDQVRHRRAHGEGADQDADGEAAALAKPRRHDLHRGRVGARHGDAGDESQDHGGPETVHPESDGGIGDRAERAARHHERTGRPHVGQIPERAPERAQDESELDGDGQRGGARITEMPLARQRGQDGRRTEPERERQQLRDGEGDQRAPPGRRKGARRHGQHHATATRAQQRNHARQQFSPPGERRSGARQYTRRRILVW